MANYASLCIRASEKEARASRSFLQKISPLPGSSLKAASAKTRTGFEVGCSILRRLIQDLVAVRYELNGAPDSFQISSTPPKRFRSGNGSIGFSLSHVLIPQDLGHVRVDLGVYSLHVQNPILIGIETRRALRTVLDCHQDVAVFAVITNHKLPMLDDIRLHPSCISYRIS